MIITHDNHKRMESCEHQYHPGRIPCPIYKVDVNVIAKGMGNQLLKRRGSVDKDLTRSLQTYVVLQYERMIKYLISDTNNGAQLIIPRKHNFDFHPTDRDIHISTFSDCWTIKLVHFNDEIRMIITHDTIKKAKRCEYHWQQWSIMRRIDKVNVNDRLLRMRNRCRNRTSGLTKIWQVVCTDM
jgi:hypothetical protein